MPFSVHAGLREKSGYFENIINSGKNSVLSQVRNNQHSYEFSLHCSRRDSFTFVRVTRTAYSVKRKGRNVFPN